MRRTVGANPNSYRSRWAEASRCSESILSVGRAHFREKMESVQEHTDEVRSSWLVAGQESASATTYYCGSRQSH